MENRYSNVVMVNRKQFRYDYKNGIVEYVSKADEVMLNDNREWQEKYGTNLWDVDADGYVVHASAGLLRENWDKAAARKEYLKDWSEEMDAEAQYLVEQFIKYEM